MKLSPTLSAILVALLVFVAAPYAPDVLLRWTVGTKIGAAALLAFNLVLLKRDMVLAIAGFLAITALFLEQRRRTVKKIHESLPANKERAGTLQDVGAGAPDLIPNEIHPERRTPDDETSEFDPSEGSGTDDAAPVGESIDEKHPLETVKPIPESISELLQEKGLAHI